MIWITAVRFDQSGHEKHENICAFRWRAADSQHQGRYTVAELIDLIRSDTLVYVSDDAFERDGTRPSGRRRISLRPRMGTRQLG